jgi:hypothetical protein
MCSLLRATGEEVMPTLEENICDTRKKIYGLTACTKCPVSCSVSSENSNQAENLQTTLAALELKYNFPDCKTIEEVIKAHPCNECAGAKELTFYRGDDEYVFDCPHCDGTGVEPNA